MTTPNKAMSFPANGAAVNVWDTTNPGGVNVNFTIVDSALGGTTALNATGQSGTIALTAAQYIPPNIEISGTLTAGVTYQIPAGVGGFWSLNNAATGAFTVNFAINGGNAIAIPAGVGRILLISDGSALTYMSTPVVAGSAGQVLYGAAANTPTSSANLAFDGTNLTVAGAVTAGSLSISGVVSGVGLSNYFASPPGIGITAANRGVFTAAYTPPYPIGNSGVTFNVNASLSNVHTVTLNSATVTMTVLSFFSGQTVNVLIAQDAGGGRVITWPSGPAFKWPGGTIPTLSTAANAVDLLVVTYIGTSYYATLTKAFA